MVRAALVLEADDGLNAFPIPTAGARLGRGGDVDLRLSGETVSRLHAAVRPAADGYVVENRSQTNPTRLNDVAIDRPAPLSDGDRLQLGSARLTFHDLAAGDRISGPLCSHCSRENRPDDHDCWYCGTSLINAPTNVLARREVRCRMVSSSGEVHDLLAGESFALTATGAGAVQRDGETLPGATTIARLDGERAIVPESPPDALRLNDRAASPRERLRCGDSLRWGDTAFVIITRVDS